MCIRDRYYGVAASMVLLVTLAVTLLLKNDNVSVEPQSVSYTHLDVYKRQKFALSGQGRCFPPAGDGVASGRALYRLDCHGPGAVSYTHLLLCRRVVPGFIS